MALIVRHFVYAYLSLRGMHFNLRFLLIQGSPGSRSHFLSPGSLAAVVNEASNKNLFVRGKLEDFVLLKSKLATCFQRLVVMQDVHLILQKQKHMTGHQVC